MSTPETPDAPEARKGPGDVLAQLRRGVLIGLGVGALVYLAFSLHAEVGSVWADLKAFRWWLLAPVLGLSLTNYAVRFMRWQLYLRKLQLEVPRRESALIFVSGLAMTITPGKVGELLKSWLLRERRGIPMARTAPVVIAERVTDLLALVLLAALGVGSLYEQGLATVITAGAALGAAVLVLQSERLALGIIGVVGKAPGAGGIAEKLSEMYTSAAALLSSGTLVAGLALATAAWTLECTGLWVVFRGSGVQASLFSASFIYAFSTIAGVVSPGGLGITDGLLVVLSTHLVEGATRSVAVSAAFIIRLCTLWFAVGLGALVLMTSKVEGTPSAEPGGD